MNVLVRKTKTFLRLLGTDRSHLLDQVGWRVPVIGPLVRKTRTFLRLARSDRGGLRRMLAASLPGLSPEARRRMIFYMPRRIRFAHRLYEGTGQRSLLFRPRTYNEKIQWRKLYCPQIERAARDCDKFGIREHVASVIGEEHLPPLLYAGTTIAADDIRACGDNLFIKPSHRSGQLFRLGSLDKTDLDVVASRMQTLIAWDYSIHSGEPWYGYVTPRALIQPWLRGKHGENMLEDFRFHMFLQPDGTYRSVIRIIRNMDHATWAYDENFERLPFDFNTQLYHPSREAYPKPPKFDEMIDAARRLADGIDYVGIDFALAGDTYYFTEITYASSGGCGPLDPHEADRWVGDLWHLDTGNIIKRYRWKHRTWDRMKQTEGTRRLVTRLYRKRDEFALPPVKRSAYTDPSEVASQYE